MQHCIGCPTKTTTAIKQKAPHTGMHQPDTAAAMCEHNMMPVVSLLAGADDFLPVLIYVVIHANPPQLASNLEYIQRFRMHSRMVSESAYFFTQLVSSHSWVHSHTCCRANAYTLVALHESCIAEEHPTNVQLPSSNHFLHFT